MVCKVAVVGTVGLPACYGGFESLVDNLIKHNDKD
ncbi:TPA: glycosyltransferase family 1 protein, partial [Escherichia coli]|nr:glycosyltransferase family 1 protein [Escherichia coli]